EIRSGSVGFSLRRSNEQRPLPFLARSNASFLSLFPQATAAARYSNPCIARISHPIKIKCEVRNDQKSKRTLQSRLRKGQQKPRRPLQNQGRSRKAPAPSRILQTP